MSSGRKVATDALETLGTLLDESAKRDAIHLAVEPVVAGKTLSPGQSVHVREGVATPCLIGQRHGIVDPFLGSLVQEGDRFWLVLNPGAVTSLRHAWSHPDFPEEASSPPARWTKEESEEWLRGFVAMADCPDYDRVLQAATDPGENWDDDYLVIQGDDASGEIPSEFWDHVENVTGKKVPHRPKYFSCTC